MSKSIKTYGLVTLIILFTISLPTLCQTHQTPLQIIPKTPIAASLDQFINFPAGTATGIANISIPIYNLSQGSLNLPISISYHSSGIKVNDIATPVGLKWNLNAGGMISRNIMGLPDESYEGWFDVTQAEADTCWDDILEDFYLGFKDPAPDIYTYSFGGKSGSYFYTKDSDLLETTDRGVIIDDWESAWDEFGNHYFFDDEESTIITTIGYGNEDSNYRGDLSGSGTTGKMLSKIKSPLNDSICFTYDDYDYDTGFNLASKTFVITWQSGQTPMNGDYVQRQVKIENTSQLIDIIESNNEKVKFEYEIDNTLSIFQKKLTRIVVTNKLSLDTIQITNFFYGTYTGDPRLKLLGIQITGEGAQDIKAYSFGYSNGSVPAYGAISQDVFGYYNSNSESHMIPQGVVSDQYFPYTWADREVDESKVATGILTSITYPTNGVAKFTYEANCETLSTGDKYAPGVRVKAVEYYDENNSLVKRDEYEYSGLEGSFHREGVFYFYYSSTEGFGFPDYLNYEKRYSSTPIQSLMAEDQYLNGFLYNKVITKSSDGNQLPHKKVEYYGGYYDNFNYTPYLKRTDMFNIDSVLVSRSTYSYDTDIFENVGAKTLSNSYVFDGYYTDCKGVTYCNFCTASLPEYDIHYEELYDVEYSSWTHTKRKDTYIEYFNERADSLVRMVDYYYNDNMLISDKVDYILSQSNSYSVDSMIVRYADDYDITSGFTSILSDSIHNMIGLPVDTRSYKYSDGSPVLIDGSSFIYNYSGQLLSEYKPKYDIDFAGVWSSDTIVTNGFQIENEYQYDLNTKRLSNYKSRSRIMGIIWGYNNSYPIAKIENSPDSLCAFTSFEDLTFGNWNGSGDNYSSESKTGDRSWSGTLSRSVSETSRLSLWSKDGAPTVSVGTLISEKTYQSADGWTFYEWLIPNNSSLTLNSNLKTIDEVRLYPTYSQMVTYTYKPSIGITSETDVNGVTSFYEYDSLGRLVYVLDKDGNILKAYKYNYAGSGN